MSARVYTCNREGLLYTLDVISVYPTYPCQVVSVLRVCTGEGSVVCPANMHKGCSNQSRHFCSRQHELY